MQVFVWQRQYEAQSSMSCDLFILLAMELVSATRLRTRGESKYLPTYLPYLLTDNFIKRYLLPPPTHPATMATAQKLYPRATLKRIIKAHSKRNVTKNVDVLVIFPAGASQFRSADSIADIPRLCSLSTNVCILQLATCA